MNLRRDNTLDDSTTDIQRRALAPTYITRSGRVTSVKQKTKMAVQLTNEQFEALIARLAEPVAKPGSFTTCHYTYNGCKNPEELEAFLAACNIFKRSEKMSDEVALEELPLLLKEEAGIWWQGIKSDVSSWKDFERRIRYNFAPSKEAYLVYAEIHQIKQGTDETTEEFIRHKRLLFSQLPPPAHPETIQLDMIYCLLRINIREKIPRSSIHNFEQLLVAARSIEVVIKEKEDAKPKYEKPPILIRENKKVKCRYCKNLGHSIEECNKKKRNSENFKPKTTIVETETHVPQPFAPKFKCYGCGAPGVVRSNCSTCHKSKLETPTVGLCSFDYTTDARDRPVLFIEVDGIEEAAYIDTCAKSSIASYTLYRRLQDRGYQFHERRIGMTLADGVQQARRVLITNAPVKLHERTILTTFLVLPESRNNHTLLGVGFIQDAHIVLNMPQYTWQFLGDDREFEMFEESFVKFKPTTALSSVTTHVAPMSPSKPEGSNSQEFLELPFGPPRLIDLPTPPHKKIRPELFDGYSPIIDALYQDALENLQDYDATPCLSKLFDTDIASVNIESLQDLLKRNSDVFKPNGRPVKEVEHTIDTGNHKPISVPPYRLTPMKTDLLRKEVTKMLNENVIEPCSFPWAAPVVMVPKKDGGIRVCVDYRQLNAVTTPDVYPLPRIDDLLHNAKPAPYMSTIDLRSGYWQIKVKEEDQCKTAFVTPFGMYKFKRMPFGLRNAPATFQRMMDRFRIKLSHIKLLVYLDDLIIMSHTLQDHLKDLQDVFDELREFNLTANRDKCNFCCQKIKYPGHYIIPEGLEIDPEKVSAIMKMAPPRNLKHLISFVQMCSWYRRFIPNFAKTAEPLTRLMKKNASWIWEEEQQRAFDNLRTLLTTSPILVQADETKPYIIKTDASNFAIGAVLVQGEGENEHPVEYASRLLTQAEKNYSTTEREALAIVWAVHKFRGYIEGAKITIMTDHQALRWLMSLKSPTGRLARWALQLQSYDIAIKYIKGRTNVVADSLSRPSCYPETEENCGICTVVIDMPRKDNKEIRNEQMKDDNIVKIVQCLENDDKESARYWSRKGYVMSNGILYRYLPGNDVENAQMVVPKHEQTNVISAYHDEAIAGHYGVEKTIARITQRYYWQGMRTQIEAYIRNCIECQRYKPSNQKPTGLLQTTTMNQRFEIIAFDLFGPLPRTPLAYNWIFIVEDIATRWIELFPLKQATAEECGKVLLNEIILRYGTPRRFISDNGTQFVSSVLQQLTYCLGIHHGFIPVYHPETNPVERKNRDLKTQLAILVQDNHTTWADKLPSIRFAMNTAKSDTTGFSSAYLTFGRELRTPDDVNHDLSAIIQNEKFIEEITPRLLTIADTLHKARELQEMKEEQRKIYFDKARKTCPNYKVGDLVLVDSHTLSKARQGFSSKLAPRRDGPYAINRRHGPSSFELVRPDTQDSVGIYHASALRRFQTSQDTPIPKPELPIRKRGRPRKEVGNLDSPQATRPRGRPPKNKKSLSSSPRRHRSQRGRL